MVLPYLTIGRTLQRSLMTDVCRIKRPLDAGFITIAEDVPCRLHAQRLFTETPDPTDANTRSMSEFAWTIPWDQECEVGDWVEKPDFSLQTIIGEVLNHDTWKMATRAFGTTPKDAVGEISIQLWRLNSANGEWDDVTPMRASVHYSRNQPAETPIRFSPAGISLNKSATLIMKDRTTDIEVGDRFTIDQYACNVIAVLPNQPQHKEAIFDMDISGGRL